MTLAETKTCLDCCKEFPSAEFYIIKGKYLASYCKPCNIKRSRRYSKENPEKRKEYVRRFREKERGTVWNKAGQVRETMVQQSRKRGWPPPEFTREEIYVIMLNGRCSKTGIPFNCDLREDGTRNPWAPSPDRIDSSKPYMKENVQWVCVMYNLAKQNWTDEEVMHMARELVNQNGDF